MGFVIDLPVGIASKSGDAIALRFGNLTGPRSSQAVVVIDGVTKESGAALAEHIKRHYRTDTVDLVVLTHPDADHSSGLRAVVEDLKVGAFWMHRPWEFVQELVQILCDSNTSASAVCRRARKSLRNAHELESLSRRKGHYFS